MVQAIIFDCFGVLTTDTWRAFLDSLPPSADLDRARELNRMVDAGLIDQDEFLDGVKEATGMRPPEVESMFRGEVVKNTPLLQHIRELKKQYRIGLVSNISSNWVRSEFLTVGEQALFDTMIFSYEVGMTKPDPRIFMLACDRLRVSPAEAVMIDDVEGNVAAARAAGLHGILYADLETVKQELSLLLRTTDKVLDDADH